MLPNGIFDCFHTVYLMRRENRLLFMILFILSLNSCDQKNGKEEKNGSLAFEAGSFGYDLDFLNKKDDSLVLLQSNQGKAMVIVSGRFQGKVFSSTAEGLHGKSFGWINYGAFDQPTNEHMNAYGGENRLWLGPEGGPYSLFFKSGSEMVFENWFTPSSIDSETWQIISADKQQVSLLKEATLSNFQGTEFHLRINRDIQILEIRDIERLLNIRLDTLKTKTVGYKTENSLTNIGETDWTIETGAPCIWILDMFNPSPLTTIIIPYVEKGQSRIATTDYFGEIPEDRIYYYKGLLLFKADGKSRGKLGISPKRAKPIAGSFDSENNILTLTAFEIDPDAVYLNQEWRLDIAPLEGDAVNAYNDGPLEDGSQMGPFYEIESVSPAAFLQSGKKLNHQHSVFHFTGDPQMLDEISREVFGISLEAINKQFQK